MDTEELLFILFREDLKRFVDKWKSTFDAVGYLNVSTTTCNAMVALKRELKFVDYKIPCERKENEQ